jgi:ferredoxin
MVTSHLHPRRQGHIETGNERVRKLRRMILELLLARCPEVEVLRDLAGEYGVPATPRFKVSGAAGASERCIVCGLCVRVCAEVIGQHAIGSVNRGGKRMIARRSGAGEMHRVRGLCVRLPTQAAFPRRSAESG